MAKFKAGDMIIGQLTMSDGTQELKVFLVNRVLIEDHKYAFNKGAEVYSLDNGDGWADSRSLAFNIDQTFELCT